MLRVKRIDNHHLIKLNNKVVNVAYFVVVDIEQFDFYKTVDCEIALIFNSGTSLPKYAFININICYF